ncbi:MAG: hydroxyphenylacetyl-CoA thioesterase PaaI [Pseudomonadota bacterium]
MTPEARARRCAALMWEADAASKWLGMRLDEVGPGTAVLSLIVAPHHANGHGICHGGYIFTLADSAFAFACNSFNRLAVAQHNTISFLKPGRVGQRLTAAARQVTAEGRSGVYDAEVTAEGEIIATFRGVSREIGGVHFDETEET